MKVLFAIVMAATYLFILWGPAFTIARSYLRRGRSSSFRTLRFILPSQVVAAFSLAFIAHELGWSNPAGWFAAATLASSAAGALTCKLLGWRAGRR